METQHLEPKSKASGKEKWDQQAALAFQPAASSFEYERMLVTKNGKGAHQRATLLNKAFFDEDRLPPQGRAASCDSLLGPDSTISYAHMFRPPPTDGPDDDGGNTTSCEDSSSPSGTDFTCQKAVVGSHAAAISAVARAPSHPQALGSLGFPTLCHLRHSPPSPWGS
ncbi:hypothetical protein CYMTET_23588 [Cymbomonas tetramitiformis]|uniref:Uncharacterized protein n=1 Tax=Cymbomonas tetramitiformis TaxID=36881 RepID=A0AAE0FXI5_9CHLO|nr:hypothetical protein CYMTET_23588 [Cymbomonas tetramitiformis]